MGVVQRHQSLKRGVGGAARYRTDLAVGRVEGSHVRRRRRALQIRVERAPVKFLAVILHKRLRRRRCAPIMADFAPQVAGRVGIHAWSAESRHQQAADSQRLIAHKLRRQPKTRPARQQLIGRVGLQLPGGRGRALAIGSARHDQPHEALHIPTALDEINREPIEQLRVRGPIALQTKIGQRADQAFAKKQLPDAIHRHPGGERIFLHRDPLREPESVLRRTGRHRRQRGGGAYFDLFPGLRVVAAVQYERVARSRGDSHDHRRKRLGERGQLLAGVLEFNPVTPQLRSLLSALRPKGRRRLGRTRRRGQRQRIHDSGRQIRAIVGAGDHRDLNQARQQRASGTEAELEV